MSTITKPVAEALAATDITIDSAGLRGKIKDDGGENCQARFRYKRAGAGNNFFVQRGRISMAAGEDLTVTQPLETPVPVGKSFVIGTARSDNYRVSRTFATFKLDNVINGHYTSIVVQRLYRADSNADYEWQVVTGDDFKVQTGEADLGGVVEKEETIDKVDRDKSFVLLSVRSSGVFSSASFVEGRLSDDQTIKMSRITAVSETVVRWQVVEWEGASVQYGTTVQDLEEGSKTVPINKVDLNKTIVLHQYKTTITDQPAWAFCRCFLLNDEELRMFRWFPGSSTKTETSWFVISHPGLSVERDTDGMHDSNEELFGSAVTDETKSFSLAPLMGNLTNDSTAEYSLDLGYTTHQINDAENKTICKRNSLPDVSGDEAHWVRWQTVQRDDWVYTNYQNSLGTGDIYKLEVTNLDPGVDYEFQTQATNTADSSDWSETQSVPGVSAGLTVKVDGVTQSVVAGSVNVSWGLTSEPGQASFNIDEPFNQSVGKKVVIEEDQTTIWSGVLVKVETVWEGRTKVYQCEAADNYYDFDRRKVPKSWDDTDAKTLIEDVVSNFTLGFTTNNVQGSGVSIKTFRSNYEEPSRLLSKLAKELNWEWYIDEFRDVHFFPPEAKNAPFELTDDNGNYYFRTLDLSQDILDLKNRVFIRGGDVRQDIAEADVIDKYKADGESKTFPLYYRYTNIQIKVNGVAQEVGADPIDQDKLDNGDVDCLYRFNPSAIRFKNDLAEGDIIKAYGEAHVPIIAQEHDADSIIDKGVREHMEIRKDIESLDEAELVGEALINRFREGSKDGSFKTKERGLKPGQQIHIQSDIRGIDDTFMITKMTGRDERNDELSDRRLVYTVNFLKAGKISFMDIMEKLLENERRNVELSPDEKIQRLISATDQTSLSDQPPTTTTTSSPYIYGEAGDELGDQFNGDYIGVYGFSTYSE